MSSLAVSAGRTQAKDPEILANAIVFSWIEREQPAPLSLTTLVKRYRVLRAYVDNLPQDDPATIATMDKLYSSMMAAAIDSMSQEEAG